MNAPYNNPYEVVLDDVRVEAEDLGGALIAAATLVDDAAQLGAGRTQLRRRVFIAREGQYDGLATVLAQAGDR